MRLYLENYFWVIDYSIDKNYRSYGLDNEILREIINFDKFQRLKGLVKEENIGFRKIFKKLGFKEIVEDKSEHKLFKF